MKIVSDTHTHWDAEDNQISPGTVFDCPDEVAKSKIAKGTARVAEPQSVAKTVEEVVPAVDATETTSRMESLVEACALLDEDDDALWTGSGVPTTDALSEAVGFKVKAAERDEAWALASDSP